MKKRWSIPLIEKSQNCEKICNHFFPWRKQASSELLKFSTPEDTIK